MRLRVLRAFEKFAAGDIVTLSRAEISALDEAGMADRVMPLDDADEDVFEFWTPTLQSDLQAEQRERRRNRLH